MMGCIVCVCRRASSFCMVLWSWMMQSMLRCDCRSGTVRSRDSVARSRDGQGRERIEGVYEIRQAVTAAVIGYVAVRSIEAARSAVGRVEAGGSIHVAVRRSMWLQNSAARLWHIQRRHHLDDKKMPLCPRRGAQCRVIDDERVRLSCAQVMLGCRRIRPDLDETKRAGLCRAERRLVDEFEDELTLQCCIVLHGTPAS